MKRILLMVAVGCAFLSGFAVAAQAYPAGGIYGRGQWRGYFTNTLDNWGDHVFPSTYNNGGNMEAFPGTINSAAEFISFIKYTQLDIDNNGSSSPREKTGAAFLIHTMISSQSSPSRNRPPTAAQIAEWESRILAAEARGQITWRVTRSYGINSYFQGGNNNNGTPNDDAFYDENGTAAVIEFRNSSGGAYRIKWQCSNPVGTLAPLSDAQNFNINGRTTVNDTTIKPGQQIQFRHYVSNAGPDATSPTNISWLAQNMPAQTTISSGNAGTFTNGQEKNVYNHTYNVPLNAVVGSQICERVGWDPENSNGARNGRGGQACATVIPDFNLTPQVITDKTNGADGDQVTFTYQVTSAGVTPSNSISCTPVGNNRPTGYTPLPQQDVARTSDGGYTAPGTNCPRVFQPNTPTTVATETITLGNLPAGSKVCRSLVVNPRNENGGPRTSAETCVLIAKTPYTHFMGNDVFAGGNFQSVNAACNTQSRITGVGRTLSDGSSAGSVSEYAAFALGRVNGFGSSSRVLVGSGTLGAAGRALTFANSEPNASLLGYYGQAQNCMNDYVAQYSASPTLAPGSYNVGTRGSGQWRVTGNVTLTGTMPAPPASGVGHQQVYYVQGDVTISGTGLTYPGTYASANAIPSLLVIATGNIYVSSSVTQMDGIYVARGNGNTNGVFYTCWPKNEPASISNACNTSQLVVNGSVIAGRIDLFRSFGATGNTPAARKEPGERFNFNPEIYIRNVLNSTSQPTIETTNILELPPRF